MMRGIGTAGTANGSPNRDPNHKHGIRMRDVASYVFLPKILPRFGELFFTGFYFFAFFMAQVYRGVRLLPEGHPSLNPSNLGQFGVRDVIAEAARHLVWKRENIDQVLVFVAILIGLVLLVLQAATFVVALAMPSAMASTPGFGLGSIFGTPPGGSQQDIAFILLDRVFGVPGVFDSCVSSPGVPCVGVSPTTFQFDAAHPVYKPDVFPWPFHYGLHALFQFYSTGLLLVGAFILLYYVIVIIAETAQTGTPFGKRFNTVWAPLRLVMAFGLLIPVSYGLNSAQWITLYIAKWGSNFATNGWVTFNLAINNSAQNMAQNMNMVVKPKAPEVSTLLQFMTLAHTCKVYEEAALPETLIATPAASQPAGSASTPAPATQNNCSDQPGKNIEAYIVKPGLMKDESARLLRDTPNFTEALKFSENRDIRIRFGDRNCSANSLSGNVEPLCGEITLPVSSLDKPGARTVQQGYFEMIKYLWGGYGSGGTIESYANTATSGDMRPALKACTPSEYNRIVNSGSGDPNIRKYALSYFQNGVADNRGTPMCDDSAGYGRLERPPIGWESAAIQFYSYGNTGENAPDYAGANPNFNVQTIIDEGAVALRERVESGEYAISPENLQRGWAVAGIWYNTIAEMNGDLIGAAWAMPSANMYPDIMMKTYAEKQQSNETLTPQTMFEPTTADGAPVLPGGQNGRDYAMTMHLVHSNWTQADPQVKTGNVLADSVNYLFGLEGLFDLRDADNSSAHPLALLVGVGRSLVESSIRNLGIGLAGGAAGILASIFPVTAGMGELASTAGGFFFSIATMTLTAGFILFYVIPFLPFLYFFFAVGNWLKGVFEAMVGVPLWALAHLRIDGQGLAGDAAMNGYFMLFEIFLRPILILFGFLASISIFAAMATVLHEIFKIAVDNLTGTGTSTGIMASIDKFFYTCMYAVIMYIMALSSFKLIDLIPNQMMRWLGTQVSVFSDMNTDPAQNLTNMTAIAGSQIVGSMTGGLRSGMDGIQKAAAGVGQTIFRNPS